MFDLVFFLYFAIAIYAFYSAGLEGELLFKYWVLTLIIVFFFMSIGENV